MGDLDLKIKAIEAYDKRVVGPLVEMIDFPDYFKDGYNYNWPKGARIRVHYKDGKHGF